MKNLIRDNKSEIPKTHELQIILSPFVNEVTKDTIWVTLDGAAKIGYYAGSDRPENTVRLEAGADNESFKSCFVDSGNCFDKKNPEPFYIRPLALNIF